MDSHSQSLQELDSVGVLSRLTAWLIDHFIVAPVVILMTVAYFEFYSFAPTLWYEIRSGIILAYVVVILYMTIGTWLFGASIGKEIMGLRVVRTDGTKASLGRIIMREVIGKLLCQLTLLYGFVMALSRPDNRGLHELMSDTVVIDRSDLTR